MEPPNGRQKNTADEAALCEVRHAPSAVGERARCVLSKHEADGGNFQEARRDQILFRHPVISGNRGRKPTSSLDPKLARQAISDLAESGMSVRRVPASRGSRRIRLYTSIERHAPGTYGSTSLSVHKGRPRTRRYRSSVGVRLGELVMESAGTLCDFDHTHLRT